jgi:hypothetical protein
MIQGINQGLKSAGYADWQVVWGPALDQDCSNMMYVVGNIASNQLAVSVRGTDWSFWLDWVEDFDNFLPLVPYSQFGVSVGANVMIAQGTGAGLAILLGMHDGTTDFKTFITTKAQTEQVLVTGHSLGGGLASVLASCIAAWLGGADKMSVYTFAAPSAGNRGFANYYNELFVSPDSADTSTAFRFYNSLDVVPNGWASLPTIETYFPPLLPCPSDIKDVVEFAAGKVGSEYVQLGTRVNGSAVELSGVFLNSFDFELNAITLSPVEDTLFLLEAAQQHHPTTYQKLLSAPPVSAATAKLKRIVATLWDTKF